MSPWLSPKDVSEPLLEALSFSMMQSTTTSVDEAMLTFYDDFVMGSPCEIGQIHLKTPEMYDNCDMIHIRDAL
jgi:hypothetical protein